MAETLRPAGYNERRCITRDVLGLYGTIITVGTYSFHDQNIEFSRDVIFKALKKCIEQHPGLGTVVRHSETEQPQLARPSQIDLAKHVNILEPTSNKPREDAIRSLLEHAHNEPLTDYETRPQWRLYMVPIPSTVPDEPPRAFHVAFATSHALADGMSGFLFHKAFLQALRDLPELSFDASPVFEPFSERPFPAALEQVGTLSISWSFLLGPLLAEYCPPWLARMLGLSKEATDSNIADKAWCGAVARPAPSSSKTFIETAVHVTAVQQDVLKALLATCRKHNARLTGVLNHILSRALARALHSRGQEHTRFAVDTAIDLRRCLPANNKESMGNYVSAVSETIDIDPASLNRGLAPSDWEAIQRTTQQLLERSNTLADQPVGLLKYLSNYRDWTTKNAAAPAKESFGMSNLGTFESGSPEGTASWVVEDMVFSQSANGTGGVFDLNVASGKHGSLNLVLTWRPGMFGVDNESKFVHDTMQDVVAQLEAIAE